MSCCTHHSISSHCLHLPTSTAREHIRPRTNGCASRKRSQKRFRSEGNHTESRSNETAGASHEGSRAMHTQDDHGRQRREMFVLQRGACENNNVRSIAGLRVIGEESDDIQALLRKAIQFEHRRGKQHHLLWGFQERSATFAWVAIRRLQANNSSADEPDAIVGLSLLHDDVIRLECDNIRAQAFPNNGVEFICHDLEKWHIAHIVRTPGGYSEGKM